MAELISLTVTQALGIAREKLEAISLRIVGEVSDVSDRPTYKAVYFSIGDESSVMNCVMWRSQYAAQGIKLESGTLVELTGKFSLYAAKGRMQFMVSGITEAGLGDLKAQIAKRIALLRAEGLFDESRKRALPRFPDKIALITSPQGKAVHDVIQTLRRRYPVAEVEFYGVRVEGDGASQLIADAINQASESEADVVLLVRGGGSYEDLLPFSEEHVARAIAASKIPVVTGIGHEPDVSIADYVADRSAPTPTASAELVTPDIQDLILLLEVKQKRLGAGLENRLERARFQVNTLCNREIIKNPTSMLLSRAQSLDVLQSRLNRAIPDSLGRDLIKLERLTARFVHSKELNEQKKRASLANYAAKLDALSPLKVLGRGYAVLFDAGSGQVISSVEHVKPENEIDIKLKDGALKARVTDVKTHERQNT